MVSAHPFIQRPEQGQRSATEHRHRKHQPLGKERIARAQPGLDPQAGLGDALLQPERAPDQPAKDDAGDEDRGVRGPQGQLYAHGQHGEAEPLEYASPGAFGKAPAKGQADAATAENRRCIQYRACGQHAAPP